MKIRKLGKHGPAVGAVGLGCKGVAADLRYPASAMASVDR